MPSDPPSERPPWMPPVETGEGPPVWDQEEADWLVGKYALIGITYLAADGETVVGQGQYHGRIVSADKEKGFLIECEGRWGGKTVGLPPFLGGFRLAKPGNYTLRSTDETVKDPDVLATWRMTEASKPS